MKWIDRADGIDAELRFGAGTDPTIRQARQLHTEVYVQHGFVGDGINWLDLDSGLVEDCWVDQSTYVSVWHEGDAVGLTRLIGPGPRRLPALEEFSLDSAIAAIPERDMLEVSSFTSGGGPSTFFGVYAHLFRGLFLATLERPERYWLAILERPLLRLTNRYFKVPFRQIGESRQLLGGETFPALLDVPAYISEMDPDSLRFVTSGVKLDLIDAWFRHHGQESERHDVLARIQGGT